MVEYRDIVSINCKKKGNKWDCEILRIISDELKEINKNLCYITKTETESGLSDVHLKEKPEMCTIDDVGTERYLRCE